TILRSLFILDYTVTQIPSVYLRDQFAMNKMIITAFIGFSILANTSGQIVTFYMFLMMWFLTGTLQGVFYGPQYGLSSEAIPQKRLTLGSAIINSGMAIGVSRVLDFQYYSSGNGHVMAHTVLDYGCYRNCYRYYYVDYSEGAPARLSGAYK